MKLKWGKYFYDMFSGILRHAGTVIMGWSGVNAMSGAGIDVPPLSLEHLGYFLIFSVVIPSVGPFWQKTPLPEIDQQVIVTTETKVTKVNPPPPTDENNPPHFPRHPDS